MTEYNNTSSYPDSVRAARITVGDIPKNYCDYLYQRDVKEGSQAGLGFGNVKYVLTCSITIRKFRMETQEKSCQRITDHF